MIVGKTPSKVMFDASAVFKDLGLSDYKIIWDFNGDGTPDKQNNVAWGFSDDHFCLRVIEIERSFCRAYRDF